MLDLLPGHQGSQEKEDILDFYSFPFCYFINAVDTVYKQYVKGSK